MKKLLFICLIFGCNALYSMQAIRNEVQYSSASSAAQKGEWDKAQQGYNKLLVDAPDNPSLLYDSGVASYQSKKFDQAGAYFNRVTQLQNVDASLKERAHFNLGNTYVEQNKLEDAIKQYEVVLKLNPENKQAKHNLEKVKEMLQQQQQQQNQDKQQDQKQDKQNQQQKQNGDGQQDKQDQEKQKDKGQQGQKQDQQQKENQQQQDKQKDQKQDGQQDKDQQSQDQSGQSEEQKDKQKGSQGDGDTQPDKDQEQGDQKQDMSKDRGQEQQKQQQDAQSKPDQPGQKKGKQEKQQERGEKHKQEPSQRESIEVTGKQPKTLRQAQDDRGKEEELEGVQGQEPKSPYDRFITAVLKEQEQADAKANKVMIKQTIDKKLRGEHGQNRW